MKLTFITGKGGVGKSLLTAALALALSRKGKKVGIVELVSSRMSEIFGEKLLTYAGIRLEKNIEGLSLDPVSCFYDYLERELPSPATALLKNRWVRHFVEAAPGLAEIVLLGKISSLLEEKPWDVLLTDAPATGHTIALCETPRVLLDILHRGPLKRTVRKIWNLFQERREVGFLLIAQPEDFILQETAELHAHLIRKLGWECHGLLMNARAETPPRPAAGGKIPKALRRLIAFQGKKAAYQAECLRSAGKLLGSAFQLPLLETESDEHKICDYLSRELEPWISKNYSAKKS